MILPPAWPVTLPLLLWRRGTGRGGRSVEKPLSAESASVLMPLSPALSPRFASGERENCLVAVSRCAHERLFSQPRRACFFYQRSYFGLWTRTERNENGSLDRSLELDLGSVDGFANFAGQTRGRKRFLNERQSRVRDPVQSQGVVGVTRHEKDLDLGISSF